MDKMNVIFENQYLKNFLTVGLDKTLSEFIDLINSNYGTNHKDFRFWVPSNDNSIDVQILKNSNNIKCIINDNVDLKNSILLSGNIKLRQMINIYKKSPNHDIIFIRFIFNGEKLSSDDKVIITELYNAGQYINRNLILSKDVPICEMLEAYMLINGIHKRSSYFLFNANKLELNDNRKLIIFRNEIINISCYLIRDFSYIIGKEIIAQSKINGKNINIKIGTLNSTKLLFDKTNGFGYYKKNLKKIYINKIILTNENENCLYSLEIRENFNCILG